MATIPELIPLSVNFPRPRLDDPATALREGLRPLLAGATGTIGIVVPPRGIPEIASLIAATAAEIRAVGASPVVIPAMGCEWGGSPEGWTARLRALGVTGEIAPVWTDDEVVMAAGLPVGEPIYVSSRAKAMDGLVLLAGAEPLAEAAGPMESSLMRMLAIGLGGTASSLIANRGGEKKLRLFLPHAATAVAKNLTLLGAATVGRNAWGEISMLEVGPAEGMFEREQTMLEKLRPAPALPVRELDLLIVDEIGKDLAETGMATGVIGRTAERGEQGPASPAIKRILVRGLTKATGGNAFGVGLADLVTQAVMEHLDYRLTYSEALVTTATDLAKIPMVFGSDRDAIEAALATLPDDDPSGLRVARIRSTADLTTVWLSRHAYYTLPDRKSVAEAGDFAVPAFDERGMLLG
jgi:hypothetical protein